MNNLEHSAGGLILNEKGEILLVENRGMTWGLPKGHVEDGETDEQAAIREVEEETGFSDVQIEKRFEPYVRPTITGGEKLITIFLMRTSTTDVNPKDTHITDWRWVTKQEAMHLLTHKLDRHFLEDALCSCK